MGERWPFDIDQTVTDEDGNEYVVCHRCRRAFPALVNDRCGRADCRPPLALLTEDNVDEWCADFFDAMFEGEPTDG